jgi:hypothetical protein
MQDQRLNTRLTNYWNLLRKAQPMPEYGHLNRAAIHDIWEQCIIYRIEQVQAGALPEFYFLSIGEKLASMYGRDMLGKTVSAGNKQFAGAEVLKKLPALLLEPAPIFDEGQFVNKQHKIVKYRACLLPFGSPEGKVTHVMCGLSWREF